MKIAVLIIILAFLPFSLECQYIRAGHEATSLFDSISNDKISKVAAYRIFFRHASVGTTINDGLNCLQGTRSNPTECKNYPEFKYDRRQWVFQARGNSGWKGKVDDFVEQVHQQLNNFDIFSFKFCYLDGIDGLLDPCGSPYNSEKMYLAFEYLRDKMEYLESSAPSKKYIWWTIPLTQSGQHCTDTLNYLIREYCKEKGKFLFDIADIQCHDSTGVKTLNDNGYEKAFSGYCGEQQPGAQACHPNWKGKILIAKAFWKLIADMSDYILSTDSKISATFPFFVFPNPASEDVTITFSNNANEIGISIYDLYGNEKASINQTKGNGNSITFNTSDLMLASGIYTIKLIINHKMYYSKLAVIR